MRKEVADLQQWMADNKLPPDQLKDLAATVASELKRVADNHLEQIEPSLIEARRQMTSEPKLDSKKPDAPKDDPLQEAKVHQEQAKITFDQLVKFLGPWASLQERQGQDARDPR